MNKIVYKIITPRTVKKYYKDLLILIDKDNLRTSKIKKSLKNSNYIILAVLKWKIIWLNQIITDSYFCAFFINLLVSEDFRNKWIWTEMIKLSIETAVKKWVKNIELVADPNNPWLKNFYSKFWFLTWNENWIYMWLKNKKVR